MSQTSRTMYSYYNQSLYRDRDVIPSDFEFDVLTPHLQNPFPILSEGIMSTLLSFLIVCHVGDGLVVVFVIDSASRSKFRFTRTAAVVLLLRASSKLKI